MITKAREAELIADIARVLGHKSEQIRAWCERTREEFRAVRDEIGTTRRRDRLCEIERTCIEAAKALRGPPTSTGFESLQDDEWLPQGGISLPNGVAVGSTGLLMLLGAASEAAKIAAERLKLPKARSTPDKDATAHYAYMLVAEFPPQKESIRLFHEGTTDAAWHAKWTPKPRRSRREVQEPSSSPDGPYLTVARPLFEYFTGQEPDKGLERSCRRVLRHLHGPRGRKRRPQRIGQTAP